MALYKDSKMERHFNNYKITDAKRCDVILNNDEVIIGFERGESFIVYQGVNNGDGHFKLTSNNIKSRATLHMFEDSSELVGTWSEGVYYGTWVVILGKESSPYREL